MASLIDSQLDIFDATMILAAALLATWRLVAANNCGGVLTEPSGLIQTPGFPAPFPVPFKCQWLLDSSGLPEAEVEIVIYLTQLFVTSGLTFTEYAFYDPLDSSLQRNPSLLLAVSEQNSITTRWLSTRSRFLVVELELERLEGNHLRALDNLLDVYGFNITYQMVTGPVINSSCSVMDCSFAGNCYVSSDYNEFWCSCFQQFYGPNCNYGPICKPDSGPCLNGGTCRHAGKYPTCTCLPEYTGSTCEVSLLEGGCREDGECSVQCRTDGREEGLCGCSSNSIRIEGERRRYVFSLRLSNVTALALQHPGRTLTSFLDKQILRFFRLLSLSRFEDLQILNISDNGDMSFHFFADPHDLSKIRDGQQKMSDRGRLGELGLVLKTVRLQQEPGLRLEGIHTNNHDVLENEQVILSCVAQGSEQIEFNWYKDGYTIDINKASGALWIETLPRNSKGEYTAILGIEAAKIVDEGTYTCQVADWGVQECKSIYLEVQGQPIVHLSPMSVSLNKGDNIDLTCVSPNQRVSYTWTRDKSLFALTPGTEVWEDLKPWGSILRISNIQKSAVYTCHSQTRSATREHSVRINLLTLGFCPESEEAGIIWKPTAPGSMAITDCPLRYIGQATRYCLTIRPGEANWEEPDFSNCISHSLDQIMIDFQTISRGYMKVSLWSVLSQLFWWFSSQVTCHRGEGEPVLDFLQEVAVFVNRTFTPEEVINVTKVFFANMDLLLSQPNSFIHTKKVGELQSLVDQWSLMWGEHMNTTMAHLFYNELVIDAVKLASDTQYRYYLPMLPNYPRWYTANIAIDVVTMSRSNFNTITIVNYQNISKFLPKISSQILRDGSELIYEMQSNVISISTHGDIEIHLELTLPVTSQLRSSWNLTCARTDLVGLDWDFTSCHMVLRAGNSSRCLCHRPGLYTTLVTKQLSDELSIGSRKLPSSMVAIGCGCCLILSILTLLLIGIHTNSLHFLKAQFCLSVCMLMAIFVYISLIEPLEVMNQLLVILLELLFFVSITSHLGMFLIIYTEVTYVPNFKSTKRMVFGLTTGTTLLPCLISWLADSFSPSRPVNCWWLPIGSISFYTAAVSTFLIVCLFLVLTVNLCRRLHYLKAIKGTKMKQVINRRLGLMKRAVVLFTTLISVAVSSVMYANSPNPASMYIFSCLSALMGFETFFCYIIHSESSYSVKLVKQLKFTSKDKEIGSDSDYNLFNFFTKQEPEVESEGAPPVATKTEPDIALQEIADKNVSKPRMVVCSDESPHYQEKLNNVELEVYPTSPKKFFKGISPTPTTSAISLLDVIPHIEVGNELRNPADSSSGQILDESLSEVSPSEVLNRISHDLEYLLDGSQSPPPMEASPRHISLVSSPSSGSSCTGKTAL